MNLGIALSALNDKLRLELIEAKRLYLHGALRQARISLLARVGGARDSS